MGDEYGRGNVIFTDSRYIDGTIVVNPRGRNVFVRRTFPETSRKARIYTWKSSDRLDRIAARYLGDPSLWWKILDENPIIQNMTDVKPGDQIRIPDV